MLNTDSKKTEIKISESASGLCEAWDTMCDAYFKQKEFLSHTEKFNPCNQHYYELFINDTLVAGVIIYRLSVSYLTGFIGVENPYKWYIIGVPASVSCSGLIGDKKSVAMLLGHIFKNVKGLILGLNIPPEDHYKDVVPIESFPPIVMSHNFENWEAYVSSLRSSYRRRLKLITAAMKDIQSTESDCARYNDKMHALYMNILDKTSSKLETLTLEFIKNLPERFRLTTYSYKGTYISWHINVIDGERIFFFIGGINYTLNNKFNAYFINLSGIVREAIEGGYKEIDFGQTAEIPKTRMGGTPVDMNMFVYHRARWVRKLFVFGRKYIHFKRDIPDANVFKH